MNEIGPCTGIGLGVCYSDEHLHERRYNHVCCKIWEAIFAILSTVNREPKHGMVAVMFGEAQREEIEGF